MDKRLIHNSSIEWKTKQQVFAESGMDITNLAEESRALELFDCIAQEDYFRFDQLCSTISHQFLYHKTYIPLISDFYVKRKLPEIAFSFISKAIEYYLERKIQPPLDLAAIRENLVDEKFCQNIKQTLGELRNLKPIDVPKVVPDWHNGEVGLDEFILEEILGSLRILTKKIRAIESIRGENKYSDLLQAILSLRLPVWGWEIVDQSRGGTSSSKKDAGEIDLTIKAKNDLVLIEALILKGKNYPVVKEHILKCKEYLPNIDCYFIIIYYKGQRDKFEHTWESYSKDVCKIKYPNGMKINKGLGFKEITKPPPLLSNFRVATTKHGKGITLYHVIVDLSSKRKTSKLSSTKKKIKK